jgi:hypothetical protein
MEQSGENTRRYPLIGRAVGFPKKTDWLKLLSKRLRIGTFMQRPPSGGHLIDSKVPA